MGGPWMPGESDQTGAETCGVETGILPVAVPHTHSCDFPLTYQLGTSYPPAVLGQWENADSESGSRSAAPGGDGGGEQSGWEDFSIKTGPHRPGRFTGWGGLSALWGQRKAVLGGCPGLA